MTMGQIQPMHKTKRKVGYNVNNSSGSSDGEDIRDGVKRMKISDNGGEN